MLTPGQILQKRRMDLRKSVSQVSQETKIQEKYIKLLESEDYSQFDSNVFINGFIKIYSEYLGLDVNKMLALYRRSDRSIKDAPVKKVQGGKKFEIRGVIKKVVTPINLLIVLAIFSLSYFSYTTITKYNQLQEKPEVTINSPVANQQIEDEILTVSGTTNPEYQLTINDEKVEISDGGEFSKEVSLKPGDNIITVEVVNPLTEIKTIKTIRVEKIEPSKEDDEKEEEKKEEAIKYIAQIELSGSEAWIQLNIDGSQKIAQTFPSGKSEEYEVKESLELVTGRPTITKLLINGKTVNLNINPNSGIGSVVCNIENNEINCSQ